MTKDLLNRYRLIVISLTAILATLFSIWYLDERIALWIMQVLRSNHALRLAKADIPDTLLFLVCSGTISMWLIYIYLTRKNGSRELQRFLQLAATAVPAAYMSKAVLQFVFGRTNTRLWLSNDVLLQFNWFHGAGLGGFPSGHMAVFTTFGAAVLYIYPRFRHVTLLGLMLLAAALIVTDYHFLGDVIAGAYLGLMVTYTTLHLLKISGTRLWIN
ncbi:MAG TPA: phosphatase PAP2 family protein [Desulfuromonadaceae bacterium]